MNSLALCHRHHSFPALFQLLTLTLLFTAMGWGWAAHAVEQEWPREIKQNGNTLMYYQPQLDSWQEQKVLKARMAVMLTLKDQKQPIAGAVWFTGDTDTDLENRLVVLDRIEIEKIRFSVLDENLMKTAQSAVQQMIPRGPITIALDRMLAGLEQTEKTTARNIDLNNAPPKILVSFEPARLLIFDGEPVFAPVPGTKLQYAVNTNWPLFTQEATSNYFLLDDNTWLTAEKLDGNWTLASTLPGDFSQLPADDNFKDARDNIPPKQAGYSKVPKFFVVTEPAELVVFTGKPKYQQIGTSGLHYATNTDADVFYYDTDKNWYLLVAGRWYSSAKSLEGPWRFATADLPKAFAEISPHSPKGRVLYSVPGTPQAQEAVLVANIPQTATVKPSEVKLTVVYAGEAEFEAITGTTPLIYYAKNTSTAVIKLSETSYYACDRGIWFSATAPTGPWAVATSVPEVIYTIPPGSPVYNVIYVVQTSSAADEVVVSYTSGYMGAYVSFGVVFWGTGYYYPPYWHYGHMPIYYPRPYTWGAHAWYNPATNTYFRGGGAYGPYGGFGAGATYNPSTGMYKRGAGAYGPAGGYRVGQAYNSKTGAWATGAAAYGPNGSYRAAQGYNPSTGTRFAATQGTNQYGNWGAGVVSRGDQWIKGGYATNDQGTVGGIKTSEGTAVIKGQNNTYVGKDGEVYRKGDSGWQKYDNGNWSSLDKPAQQPSQQPARSDLSKPAPDQGLTTSDRSRNLSAQQGAYNNNNAVMRDLNYQNNARVQGAQRTQQLNRNYGSAPRGGGGGARGGRR